MVNLKDIKKKDMKYVLIIYGVSIVMGTIIVIGHHIYWTKKKDKYHRIERGSDGKGVVKDVFTDHGAAYITLKDESKHVTVHTTRNFDYSPAALIDFIQRGDSIVKPLNNDTLYVYRKQSVYYFVIGQWINEKDD